MNKAYLVIVLMVFAAVASKAQKEGQVTVTGKVVDAGSNEPLEFTTVSFLNTGDSSIVSGGITDASGNYEVSVNPGNYIQKVQFLSYNTEFNTVKLSEDVQSKDLGTVMLSENVSQLQEIEIKGKRTEVEMKLDKRVFNIGSDLMNQGLNVSEILDNLPSITVDMEGNISLRGSQNVKVLINGKESGLTGLSGNQALQMLNGNMIERVEVITNPSARYEAEGSAGIINIILKKDRKAGINGTFNLSAGYPTNHDIGINLNYRKDWFNLFVNYGLGYRDTPRDAFTKQEYFENDTSYFIDIDRDMSRAELSNSFRFGSDFYLNEKNIITVSGLYNLGDGDNDSELLYNYYDENRNLVSQTRRFNFEKEDEELLEYEINYEREFEKKEHKLTFAMQYRNGGEVEDSELETFEDGIENPVILAQSYLNDESEENILIRGDYVHPFTDKEKLEVGLRSTLRGIDNEFKVEEQNEAGEWFIRNDLSNNFLYDEDIHAVYGIYGKEFEKFDAQAGLRLEYTRIETELVKTQEYNNIEYLNLFPSIHFTYDVVNDNSVQLSYSRRFDRPSFWDLNPFLNFEDTLRRFSGNPKLQPEFTHSFELGYLNNWEKGSFYYGAYYRNTSGVHERISTLRDGIIYIQPENLSKRHAYGLESNISQEITEWWNVDGNINLFRSETRGEYEGRDLSAETFSMSARMSTKITFLKEYEIQARGFYRAPERMTQGIRRSMYSMDVGVSRDLFKGKGTVTLRSRNVLNSMRFRYQTETEGFNSDANFQWRPRQIVLSLSYRLNNDRNRRRGGGRDGGGYNGGGDDGGGEF